MGLALGIVGAILSMAVSLAIVVYIYNLAT